MGQALRGSETTGGAGRRAARALIPRALAALVVAVLAVAIALSAVVAPGFAQETLPAGAQRLDRGRFTVVAYPNDLLLARSMLDAASTRDTFPGLPRLSARVVIAIAPDATRFRQLIGPNVPEWGAAVAFPASQRIVMQGRSAGSDAGDPIQVLRHELAHLALHEVMGELPPRWFDEGYASYAAAEWGRDEALLTNLALALGGMPSLDSLEAGFHGGARSAEQSYALAYRAVAELASLDSARGLTLFFRYWQETRSFDRAVRSAYGMTQASFEKLWHSRTRRRYGVLALVTNLSIAVGLFSLVLGPFYVARRRRDRERMAALRAADAAAERAERESALSALLAMPGVAPADGSDDQVERAPPVA